MPTTPDHVASTTRPRRRRERRVQLPLSVIHAEALWWPRPPVGYDDEGYPCESRNISESTRHDDALSYFRNAAAVVLRDQPEAIVQQNLLFLFEEGNPHAAIEPDVTVALGVGRRFWGSSELEARLNG